MACFLCPERKKLETELTRLTSQSRNPVQRPPVDAQFRQRVICHVVTPHGRRPYTIGQAEDQYKVDHPGWSSSLVRIPPGVLYNDKLKEMERATDLEKRFPGGTMPDQIRGNYENRCGTMGESVAVEAFAQMLEGRTAFLLSGFSFQKHLEGVKKTKRADMEPNMSALGIKNILLYFACKFIKCKT